MDRCEQVAIDRRAGGLAARRSARAVEPERLAVVVGTGIGGALTLLGQDDVLETSGARKVSPLTVPMLMPNGPAAMVGLELGSRGGVHAPVSACASGSEALAWALTGCCRPTRSTWWSPAARRPASPASRSPGSPRCGR